MYLIEINMEHNKHIIVPRKYRKDKTEVSCVVKYLMFGFNVLFWVSAIQWNHFFFQIPNGIYSVL